MLAGPESLQVVEPKDHALGRSQGGFGTKVHLVCDRLRRGTEGVRCGSGGFGTKVHLICDSHGIVLAVWVTPGQRHESQAFAVVLLRAQRPRRAGRQRWPLQVAGDKGYRYPEIRHWLRRRHIRGVIPTRKDQVQEASFDKAAYRRRSRIEQVIGWYKECRALGTRYEKLAVN